MEWLRSHKLILATIGIAVLAAAVSLVLSVRRETVPPSVPEVTQTVATQEAVTSATSQVLTGRTTNDEAIKTAYEQAKRDTMALSADAVVVELNLLLDELRGGEANP